MFLIFHVFPIDDDPGHIFVGWPQSVRELSVEVQELHATVPPSTLHDGIWGHLWRIDLQARLQILLHVIHFL